MDSDQLNPEIVKAAGEPFGEVPEYDLEARVAAVVDYSVRAGRRSRSFVGTPGARVQRGRRSWTHINTKFIGTAIAAVAIIGITYALTGGSRTTPTTTPVAQMYKTVAGQRASFKLADGSLVNLAPATTLRVVGREVELNGEAIFTVVQKSDAAFIVKAGNSTTRVLGTRFSVRRYIDDVNTRVVVANGRVSVSADSHPSSITTLVHGDMATIDQSGATSVVHDTPIDAVLGWSDGWLVFRSRNSDEVASELSRWYGVTIRFTGPSVGKSQVSMVIRPGDKADAAIRALADATGSRVQHTDGIYTLSTSN